MFNRKTKLTAVLVAAASIMSTVPAMAATKLSNKTGDIEHAVAFKDGKYLYEGYKGDDSEDGVYYSAGDKDKKLENVDSLTSSDADAVKTFNKQYVTAFDSDKEYAIDLTSGKATEEDNTLEDIKSNAETKIQRRLEDTKRYDDGCNSSIGDQVPGVGFDDVWFEYSATTEGGGTGFGYTNESGKYIDCSYDQNIYAYNGERMAKLKNVGEDDNGVTLNAVSFVKTLGQDDKYIYSIIKADLTGAKDVYKNGEMNEAYFVQKVSKAQGDKERDAYKPKTTDTYQIADKSVFNNGDVEDAYKILMNENNAFDGVRYAIVDGTIYATYNDGDDKVKTYKIGLKSSEKIDRTNDAGDKLSYKVGAHVAKKDSDKDTDIVQKGAWDIDVNGTVWALDKGAIKKSVKAGDFETVYTCDRSMKYIDVYDENNLIAWDSEDVYTTANEGSAEAKKEAEDIVGTQGQQQQEQQQQQQVAVKTGWQSEGSTWYLYDQAGNKLTGWQSVGGSWYYMDPTTTAMQTGWVSTNGKWYYTNANGAMVTGWQQVNGKWYYLNPGNGDCAMNTTVDGYVLGADGAWIQ